MKTKIALLALAVASFTAQATNDDNVQKQLDDLKAGLHQAHFDINSKYADSWGLEDRANIAKLQEQKLDKSVFTADQQRQDAAIGDVKLTAGQAFDIAVEGRATADNALTTVYGLIPQVNNNAKGIADLQESKVDKSVFTADQQRQDKALAATVTAQAARDAGQDDHINAVQGAAQTANDRAGALEVRADAAESGIRETNAQLAITDKRSQNNAVRLDGVEKVNTQQGKAIASNTQRITTSEGDIKQLYANGEYAHSRIDAANANIEANRSALAASNKRIADNTAQLANHEQRLGNLEQQTNRQFASLGQRIDKVQDKANAGTATALAAAGIPQVTGEQRFSLGAAVGGYESENALAVGFSSRVTQNVVVKASVATDTQHGVGYNVGASVGW